MLLIAVFATDVAARFAPMEPLCFQAWECLTRYQEPGAIFEANRRFEKAHTHGNLSNMGNLPQLRVDRPQVFSTDGRGFRNAANLTAAPLDGLVLGDSFVAGYGMSDDDTFPVQLSKATGLRFYNAGGPYSYAATARRLAGELPLRTRDAIVIWTEGVDVAEMRQAEAAAMMPDRRTRLVTALFGARGERLRSTARGWYFTSPLKIIAEKAFLSISNDVVLPNRFAANVVQRRLVNGTTMLFYPRDVHDFHAARDVTASVDHLRLIAARMREAGFNPAIVLAPSKYTVYQPLIAGGTPPAGDAVHPLRRIAAALAADGIRTLDLTDVLQAAAATELPSGRYVYWRDDTHWNRAGVAVAADAVQRAWFSSNSHSQGLQ